MPIDINLLRTDKGINIRVLINILGGDPNKIKETIKARFKDEKVVDEILELDAKWRKCKYSFIPEQYVIKDII